MVKRKNNLVLYEKSPTRVKVKDGCKETEDRWIEERRQTGDEERAANQTKIGQADAERRSLDNSRNRIHTNGNYCIGNTYRWSRNNLFKLVIARICSSLYSSSSNIRCISSVSDCYS